MTSKRCTFHPGIRLALTAGLVFIVGCQIVPPRPHVELTSYKDPYFPELFTLEPIDCAYRIGRLGDLHVAARTRGGTDTLARGDLTEYLQVHMYWRPNPERTFTNSTAANATFRYVVAGSEGVLIYTGTGYAYPRKQERGQLVLELESGQLRVTSRSGTLEDVLGATAIHGTLVANQDSPGEARIGREVEQLAAR